MQHHEVGDPQVFGSARVRAGLQGPHEAEARTPRGDAAFLLVRNKATLCDCTERHGRRTDDENCTLPCLQMSCRRFGEPSAAAAISSKAALQRKLQQLSEAWGEKTVRNPTKLENTPCRSLIQVKKEEIVEMKLLPFHTNCLKEWFLHFTDTQKKTSTKVAISLFEMKVTGGEQVGNVRAKNKSAVLAKQQQQKIPNFFSFSSETHVVDVLGKCLDSPTHSP